MTLLTAPSASQQRPLTASGRAAGPALRSTTVLTRSSMPTALLSPRHSELTAWLQSQASALSSGAGAQLHRVSGTSAQANPPSELDSQFQRQWRSAFLHTTPLSIRRASGIVTGFATEQFRAKSYLQHKLPKYTYPVPDTNPQHITSTWRRMTLPRFTILAAVQAGIDARGRSWR